jgi:hypothetical protein
MYELHEYRVLKGSDQPIPVTEVGSGTREIWLQEGDLYCIVDTRPVIIFQITGSNRFLGLKNRANVVSNPDGSRSYLPGGKPYPLEFLGLGKEILRSVGTADFHKEKVGFVFKLHDIIICLGYNERHKIQPED